MCLYCRGGRHRSAMVQKVVHTLMGPESARHEEVLGPRDRARAHAGWMVPPDAQTCGGTNGPCAACKAPYPRNLVEELRAYVNLR